MQKILRYTAALDDQEESVGGAHLESNSDFLATISNTMGCMILLIEEVCLY